MKLGWRLFAGGALVLCAAFAWRDMRKQHRDEAPPPAFSGALLPSTRTQLADPREEARAALAVDAFRRELRFAEAVEPGRTFAATRIPRAQLETLSADEIFRVGQQLFELRFTARDGFGAADLPPYGRVHRGRRGGPDAFSCADCHRRGGPAGAGDAVDNAYLDGDGERPASALERNPISLQGAGLLELLAREMSDELDKTRAAALREAKSTGEPQRIELSAKGVSFGTLGVSPDGSLDTSAVAGVDPDLRVRPFGWKGHAADLREVVEDELALHHGLQSSWLARFGPTDVVGSAPRPDPDGDGVVDEISDGQLDALTVFVALQELPQIEMPTEPGFLPQWAQGEKQFHDLGCAKCHVPSLPLASTVYSLPGRGGERPIVVDLARDGADPRLQRAADGSYRVYLFSDLRRHTLGRSLREPRSYRATRPQQFLTPPLWGLARSRPYLHDARAPTIEAAIIAHGGEAVEARKAFAALTDAEKAPLRIYLTSLTRARRFVAP